MRQGFRKASTLVFVVLGILVILAAIVIGGHFFYKHKAQMSIYQAITDKNTLYNVAKNPLAAPFSGKLDQKVICRSINLFSFHCNTGSGSVYSKESNSDILFFDNIEITLAFQKLKGLHVTNIRGNPALINDKKLENMLFPAYISLDAVDMDKKNYNFIFDGAFGDFKISSTGDSKASISYEKDKAFKYIYDLYAKAQEKYKKDTPDFITFKSIAKDILQKQKKEYIPNTFMHNAIVSIENIVDEKSNGLKIDIFVKTDNKNKIQQAITKMLQTKSDLDKSVMEAKVTNL
ncbi:MAG: hypothetical protein ACK5LP_03260 [Campylobacteraceae bacterium]